MDCLAGLFGPKKGIGWLGSDGPKLGLDDRAFRAKQRDWLAGLSGPKRLVGQAFRVQKELKVLVSSWSIV